MSIPTVTITVTGSAPSTEDAETLASGLHVLYVQATKFSTSRGSMKRRQFILFPHANPTLGVEPTAGNPLLLLKRTQDFEGNRSKWFHHKVYEAPSQALQSELADLAKRGYELAAPLAVPLEQDDYVAAWNGETPHKAMRAVDRALASIGLSIKK